jgi:hypothetical protein
MKTLYIALTIAVVTIFVISRILQRSNNQLAIPHNIELNSTSASEAITRLKESPTSEVFFAISDGFWHDDSSFDEIFASYNDYYEKRLAEFIEQVGPPTFEGHWMQDEYPVFAVGERVAVWTIDNNTIYLRLHHEDKETGIIVSLLTPKSPDSNHDSKSIYEESRKFARLMK